VKAIRRYGIGAEIPRGHAGFSHGCPIQASKPRSLNRHVWMAPGKQGFSALWKRRSLAVMCPAFDHGRGRWP